MRRSLSTALVAAAIVAGVAFAILLILALRPAQPSTVDPIEIGRQFDAPDQWVGDGGDGGGGDDDDDGGDEWHRLNPFLRH
jgi:hypothetical protein